MGSRMTFLVFFNADVLPKVGWGFILCSVLLQRKLVSKLFFVKLNMVQLLLFCQNISKLGLWLGDDNSAGDLFGMVSLRDPFKGFE